MSKKRAATKKESSHQGESSHQENKSVIGELVIEKAVYGIFKEPARTKDFTDALAAKVVDGSLNIRISNDLAGGDPAFGHLKEARVTYVFNGVRRTVSVPEHGCLAIPTIADSISKTESQGLGSVEIKEGDARADHLIKQEEAQKSAEKAEREKAASARKAEEKRQIEQVRRTRAISLDILLASTLATIGLPYLLGDWSVGEYLRMVFSPPLITGIVIYVAAGFFSSRFASCYVRKDDSLYVFLGVWVCVAVLVFLLCGFALGYREYKPGALAEVDAWFSNISRGDWYCIAALCALNAAFSYLAEIFRKKRGWATIQIGMTFMTVTALVLVIWPEHLPNDCLWLKKACASILPVIVSPISSLGMVIAWPVIVVLCIIGVLAHLVGWTIICAGVTFLHLQDSSFSMGGCAGWEWLGWLGLLGLGFLLLVGVGVCLGVVRCWLEIMKKKGKLFLAIIILVVFIAMIVTGVRTYYGIKRGQVAEEGRRIEEIEARVRDFAENNLPEQWQQYVKTKNFIEIKTSVWLKSLEEGEFPDDLKAAAEAEQKKGLSKSKVIDLAKGMVRKKHEESKNLCDSLLREMQDKYQAFLRDEAEKKERLAKENELAEQEQKESAAREHNKEEKLKNFALQEAPQMWQTYVTLGESIESQAVRLEELRKTLESVEQDPSQDRDYATLVSMRDEMIKSRDALHEKIKQAYLQYSKFLATPGNAELKALHKKTMEDGVREAEATMKHYREMTKEK